MKPKLMAANFIIEGTVYPFDVMCSFGESDSDLEQALKERDVDTTNANIGTYSETLRGRCVQFESGQVLVRLFKYPKTSGDYGDLQHELFHAVYFIMERIGIKLTTDSDEAFAYLIGYLTAKIYAEL